jgi:hypothetical protein
MADYSQLTALIIEYKEENAAFIGGKTHLDVYSFLFVKI